MNFVRCSLIVLISLLASAQSMAQENLPAGVTLYAGGNLEFNGFSTISGGSVVAGGDVLHTGGVLTVDQISATGGFTAEGAAFQETFGPFIFNGNISQVGGPGAIFDGPITSNQGNIVFLNSSQTVNGDVTASGDIEFDFVFGTINGNVAAGGNINITATVNGTTTGVPTNLAPFTLPALPAGRTLTASAFDIDLETFENITLAPGFYGTLTYASSNTVTLTAGSYVFEDIVSEFSLNELSFDTTAGNIDLFIAGDDFEFDNLIQVIDGVALFVGDVPAPALSNNIFIEAAGNLTLGSEVYGTFFAPNGDVTINGFSDVTGRVFAGGDMIVNGVDIVTASEAEPEPEELLGDINQDGIVSFSDLAPFIVALASNTYVLEADCNQDGVLNFLDIISFIEILIAR